MFPHSCGFKPSDESKPADNPATIFGGAAGGAGAAITGGAAPAAPDGVGEVTDITASAEGIPTTAGPWPTGRDDAAAVDDCGIGTAAVDAELGVGDPTTGALLASSMAPRVETSGPW